MVTSPDATVLVVDDTLGNLAAAGFFLEGLCSTAAALTGQEALELALKLQPDGILLDVIMPGMSGIDVPKQLQSNPITKSIAVLLVTSLSNPDSKLEGFACRAVDFVTKPFLAEELRARVATQLRIRHLQHELRQQIRSLNVELSEGRQNFDFLAQHTSSCLLCLDAWMPGTVSSSSTPLGAPSLAETRMMPWASSSLTSFSLPIRNSSERKSGLLWRKGRFM